MVKNEASSNESLESIHKDDMKQWIEVCENSYEDYVKHEERQQRETLLSRWAKNLEKVKKLGELEKSRPVAIHPSMVQSERLVDSRLGRVKGTSVFREVHKNGRQEVESFVLRELVSTPFTLSWHSTCGNIRCEDGSGLLHMPYISDQVIEKELDFIESLIEVNGNSNTTFTLSNLSDAKKIRLLNDCLAIARKTDPSVSEPSDAMIAAVSKLCAVTTNSVQTLWLTEKQKSEPNVTPSIDQTDHEWGEEQGSTLMDSLNDMFCPRCYM